MVRSSERSTGDRRVSTTTSTRVRPSRWRGLDGADPLLGRARCPLPPVGGPSGERWREPCPLPHEYFSDGQTIPWTLAPSHPSPPGLPRTRADYPPGSLTLSLELSLTPWLAKPPFKRVRATPSIFPGSQGCRWTRQTIPWTLAPSHSCLSCLSHLGSRADLF